MYFFNIACIFTLVFFSINIQIYGTFLHFANFMKEVCLSCYCIETAWDRTKEKEL